MITPREVDHIKSRVNLLRINFVPWIRVDIQWYVLKWNQLIVIMIHTYWYILLSLEYLFLYKTVATSTFKRVQSFKHPPINTLWWRIRLFNHITSLLMPMFDWLTSLNWQITSRLGMIWLVAFITIWFLVSIDLCLIRSINILAPYCHFTYYD